MTDPSPLLTGSVELILRHQAPSGGYVAAPDFGPYRYSWFRDGAFIADAVSRVGEIASADRFHDWCARVLDQRRDQVEELIARAAAGGSVAPDEHLHTRYTLDGEESPEPWWTFQLDGYGTWLWALEAHRSRHERAPTHVDAVALVVRYLAAFWDQPCYDWWEEHPHQVHTATLAAMAGGLRAVAGWDALPPGIASLAGDTATDIVHRLDRDAVHDGHLTKWLGSTAVDASLTAAFVPFDLYPVGGPVAEATIARIERELAPAGVHRYLDDSYYGGGEWILLAGFLGWYHAMAGDRDRAFELFAWMCAQADEDGCLPEQVTGHLLHPGHEQRWIQRWGPSAKPLLWSHAMLLTLGDALELGHLATLSTGQEQA